YGPEVLADLLPNHEEGERVGRGGRGRGPRGEGVNGGMGGAPDFSTIIAQQLQNLLPAILAQVGNQGNVGNQNGNVVNEKVQENIKNVLVNDNRKMESVQDMSGCSIDQKVKYTAGSFVGKALMWWNSQIRTLSQEVVVSMSWNDFKFMMIEEFCPSHEMQKLETELWNHVMVGVGHVAYTDRFHELARIAVIMEYLVNISKRRSLWSLNEDILKITILKTNTPYPSRKYGVSMPELTKDHEGNKLNTPYPEKTNTPY
ncbi:reverse transcriptase domain-containing protein, partial [Tanacetum coccineum]